MIKKVFIEGKKIFFIGGTLSFTAYGAIVWAFTHAPVSIVAANDADVIAEDTIKGGTGSSDSISTNR